MCYFVDTLFCTLTLRLRNISIPCQKNSMNQTLDMSALCIDHITKTLLCRQTHPWGFHYLMLGIAIWCSIWLSTSSTCIHIQFVILLVSGILHFFLIEFFESVILKKMRICLILRLCVCTHQFLNSEHNMYLVRYCEYVAIWFEYLLQKKKILIFKSPKLVS